MVLGVFQGSSLLLQTGMLPWSEIVQIDEFTGNIRRPDFYFRSEESKLSCEMALCDMIKKWEDFFVCVCVFSLSLFSLFLFHSVSLFLFLYNMCY